MWRAASVNTSFRAPHSELFGYIAKSLGENAVEDFTKRIEQGDRSVCFWLGVVRFRCFPNNDRNRRAKGPRAVPSIDACVKEHYQMFKYTCLGMFEY